MAARGIKAKHSSYRAFQWIYRFLLYVRQLFIITEVIFHYTCCTFLFYIHYTYGNFTLYIHYAYRYFLLCIHFTSIVHAVISSYRFIIDGAIFHFLYSLSIRYTHNLSIRYSHSKCSLYIHSVAFFFITNASVCHYIFGEFPWYSHYKCGNFPFYI